MSTSRLIIELFLILVVIDSLIIAGINIVNIAAITVHQLTEFFFIIIKFNIKF